MVWMVDEYKRTGPSDIVNANASVTGKPLSSGGISGRTDATGRDVQYAIQSYLRDPNQNGVGGERDLSKPTVSVHGFGNVGYHAANFLSGENSATFFCVIERDGYLWRSNGFGAEAVKRHQLLTCGIPGFPDAISLLVRIDRSDATAAFSKRRNQ